MTAHQHPGGLSLEACIRQCITSDGSVIVPPRMARWLEKQAGMTADRRIRLRDNDPEAYVVMVALHLVALGSDSGTNDAEPLRVSTDSNMWMNTSEAAKAMNVTDRCVRKRCATGRLHAVRDRGNRWLINRNTINLNHIA